MKKNTIDSSVKTGSKAAAKSKKDATETSFSDISKAFGKTVRENAKTVKKTIAATMHKEMSNIKENAERLVHGKA